MSCHLCKLRLVPCSVTLDFVVGAADYDLDPVKLGDDATPAVGFIAGRIWGSAVALLSVHVAGSDGSIAMKQNNLTFAAWQNVSQFPQQMYIPFQNFDPFKFAFREFGIMPVQQRVTFGVSIDPLNEGHSCKCGRSAHNG